MEKMVMFTSVGGEEVVVGTCSSAQARILTKRKHAVVDNGRLRLNLRPIHLALAENSSFRSPKDDENVSTAELDRRKVWLASLFSRVVQIETEVGTFFPPKPSPKRATAPRKAVLQPSDQNLVADEEASSFFAKEDPDGELDELPSDLWMSAAEAASVLRVLRDFGVETNLDAGDLDVEGLNFSEEEYRQEIELQREIAVVVRAPGE